MEVAVVGGGPAGAAAARLLAADGAQVTLFDASHPREKPCGGGLTGRALALLPPAPPRDPPPAREIGECWFDSGTGDALRLDLDRPVRIAARRDLDAWLLRRAIEAGVRHVAERVVEVSAGGDLRTAAGRAAAFDLIVGADGAGSVVRRHLRAPIPRERLAIAGGWYARGDGAMAIRFLPGIAGYVWTFPRADHVGVGICAPLGSIPTRDLLARLESETARLAPALLDPDAERYAHTIPSPSADPASILEAGGERFALVGDAAALADPITGEGIGPALHSAQILARAVREDGHARHYPERLLEELGRDLLRAAALKARFYAPGFSGRVLRYARRSGAIREILADLVLGRQDYGGLRRRLLGALPRFALDSLLAGLRS